MKRAFAVSAVLTVFLCFSLLFSGCSSENNKNQNSITTDTYSQDGYTVSETYPTGELEYGNTFQIVLKLVYPSDEKYTLYPLDKTSSDAYKNTVINSVNESSPTVKADGTTETTINFDIEAWLPGKLVFPALTIGFSKDIHTEDITLDVKSAFTDEDSKSLAPIYVPKEGPGIKLIVIIAAAVLIIAVAVFFLIRLICKRKKQKQTAAVRTKSRKELLEEFRKNYIDSGQNFDLRRAFYAISEIMPVIADPRLRDISERARFSRESVTMEEGCQALYDLYQKLVAELNKEETNEF